MKTHVKVAVASRSFSKNPVLRKELEDKYPGSTFNDAGKSLKGAELISFLKGHPKIITALETLDRDLLNSLPGLEIVSKYGVGIDMIDLEAMEEKGIKLGWEGGVNKRSVSELVISSMIALLHCSPRANSELKQGIWQQIKGKQLTGRTVGIIGCGHVGKDLAILLKSFNCKILSYDIKKFPEFYEKYQIVPIGLNDLLSESDIITLHLPLDESTENILDAKRLELLRQGAYVINMARGRLLDELKLKEMLLDGRIAGAAIDAFSHEPPQDKELLNMPNVLATPHIGGSTEEAILAMGRSAIKGLENAQLPSKYEF